MSAFSQRLKYGISIFSFVILAIITAWLLVPVTDILTEKVIYPFSALLPYKEVFISIIVSFCVCLLCILSLIITFLRETRL